MHFGTPDEPIARRFAARRACLPQTIGKHWTTTTARERGIIRSVHVFGGDLDARCRRRERAAAAADGERTHAFARATGLDSRAWPLVLRNAPRPRGNDRVSRRGRHCLAGQRCTCVRAYAPGYGHNLLLQRHRPRSVSALPVVFQFKLLSLLSVLLLIVSSSSIVYTNCISFIYATIIDMYRNRRY